MAIIKSEEQLRALYPSPKGRVLQKTLYHIDPHGARFIALSPILMLSTQGPDGIADVTPRGDHPGFVQVLDDTHVAIPDRPGNNKLDSLGNIIANPAVGLVFLVPGVNEVYRINGDAEIRDDADLLGRFEVHGKRPVTVLVVSVKEAFLHCAKALMRSKLWDPAQLPDQRPIPTMGQMISDQVGDGAPIEPEAEMVARYQAKLY